MNLSQKVREFPEKPGCYCFINSQQKIVYVGKAKNLKKRVMSYFSSSVGIKTRSLIAEAEDCYPTITTNETEALLLEQNLIKHHQPKFNILLRDDKSYPFIQILRGAFPQLRLTRKISRPFQDYIGPYVNVKSLQESLKKLQKIFQLRTCSNNEFRSRKRPCLKYDMKMCSAPCVGKISQKDYQEDVKNAVSFLRAERSGIQNSISQAMSKAASEQDYERAALLRDQLFAIQNLQSNQAVVSHLESVDVWNCKNIDNSFIISLMQLRDGKLLGFLYFSGSLQDIIEQDRLLEQHLEHYYLHTEHKTIPRSVCILQADFTRSSLEKIFEVIGSRTKISTYSQQNIEHQKWKEMAEQNSQEHHDLKMQKTQFSGQHQLFNKLAEILYSQKIAHIDTVDVSHFQGSNTYAVAVRMEHGAIFQNANRLYKIASASKNDDYQAMREFTMRHFKLENFEGDIQETETRKRERPDLLVIDGGKGQMSCVYQTLQEIGYQHPLTLLAVTKDDKRIRGNERFFVCDYQFDVPLGLRPVSFAGEPECLKLLLHLRDEAHRLCGKAQRKAMIRTRKHSKLEDIPGIGPEKRQKLLVYFRSIEALQQANISDLMLVPSIGKKQAESIFDYFHQKNQQVARSAN